MIIIITFKIINDFVITVCDIGRESGTAFKGSVGHSIHINSGYTLEYESSYEFLLIPIRGTRTRLIAGFEDIHKE